METVSGYELFKFVPNRYIGVNSGRALPGPLGEIKPDDPMYKKPVSEEDQETQRKMHEKYVNGA